jgi:hypothetical protein
VFFVSCFRSFCGYQFPKEINKNFQLIQVLVSTPIRPEILECRQLAAAREMSAFSLFLEQLSR